MSTLTFLADTQARVSQLPKDKKSLGSNPLFDNDVQELDGFCVGFMDPDLFSLLCTEHDLDPLDSEAILMQASAVTEPHLHMVGRSTFLPLGIREGYESGGGTFVGPCNDSNSDIELSFQAAVPDESFVLEPDIVHCFTPGKSSVFSALALVQPRICRGNGKFDITRFEDRNVIISDDGMTAILA